jgi:hypothetical protein
MPLKPPRRALPTLFLSDDEYNVLAGMATERAIAIADLLKEVISPLVEGDGRVVVLRLPEGTWSAFAAFFEGGDEGERAMVRCLMADADDFDRATIQAGAGSA